MNEETTQQSGEGPQEMPPPDEATTLSRTLGIQVFGSINWAHERGSYAGCKAKIFHATANGPDLDEQMNEFFAHVAHAALVVDILPLDHATIIVMFTRRYSDMDQEKLNQYNRKFAEWAEEDKLTKLKREQELQASIDKANKAAQLKRDKLQKQTEQLMKAAVRHLNSCKKDPEAAAEAKQIMFELKKLDEEPRQEASVEPIEHDGP